MNNIPLAFYGYFSLSPSKHYTAQPFTALPYFIPDRFSHNNVHTYEINHARRGLVAESNLEASH